MTKNKKYDIIFCSFPFLSLERIYSAPALLKGIVNDAGYKSKCHDFVIDFFSMINRDIDYYGYLSNYETLDDENFEQKDLIIIDEFIKYVTQIILNSQTKYIGFSVFSRNTQKLITKILIELQKNGFDNTKIVLGGRGLADKTSDPVKKILNLNPLLKKPYYNVLKELKLATNFIIGDGEEAILNFLSSNISHEKHNFLSKLQTNLPNYDDYDFTKYLWTHNKYSLDVIGSKGCIRKCDFCNVKEEFGKFIFKNGRELAEELIQLQKIYKINRFMLTDSLVNGGLKPFYEFLQTLSLHNFISKTPISWSGQYICRDMRNYKNYSDYYDLLKSSGAEGLTIGAESGSDDVLKYMLKNTSNDAMLFELEEFRKRKITCFILTFIGHWSEKHEDFIKHCKMLINLAPYIQSGTISMISLGVIFKLDSVAAKKENIFKFNESGDIWLAQENLGNTYKVRLQRRLIISKLMKKLNLLHNNSFETRDLQQSYFIAKNYQNIMNDFYNQYKDIIIDDFTPISDADKFVESILAEENNLRLEVDFYSSASNNEPQLIIKINENVVSNNLYSTGNYKISLNIEKNKLEKNNILSFQLANKEEFDTIVDDTGKILQDKFIEFKRMYVNNFDIFNNINFFYKNFYKQKDKLLSNAEIGLWDKSFMKLDFTFPFTNYMTNKIDNNSNEVADLNQRQTKSISDLSKLHDSIKEIIKNLNY